MAPGLLCIEMLYEIVHGITCGRINRCFRRVLCSKLRDAGSVQVQTSLSSRYGMATKGSR